MTAIKQTSVCSEKHLSRLKLPGVDFLFDVFLHRVV